MRRHSIFQLFRKDLFERRNRWENTTIKITGFISGYLGALLSAAYWQQYSKQYIEKIRQQGVGYECCGDTEQKAFYAGDEFFVFCI